MGELLGLSGVVERERDARPPRQRPETRHRIKDARFWRWSPSGLSGLQIVYVRKTH